MGNAIFGWQNNLKSASLTAGSEATGLGAANLATDQGSPSTGWQTQSGVVTDEGGAYFFAETGDPGSRWKALLLARTNLSPSAQIRWRLGTLSALREETPVLDLDITEDWALPDGWTFSRTSKGWTFDAAGTLVEKAAHEPRLYYDPVTLEFRGLLVEPTRVNYVGNPRMEGAAVGSPGALPTGWSHRDIPAGIDVEVAEVGTEGGIPYIDLRFSGTASVGGIYKLATMGFVDRAPGAPNTAGTRHNSNVFVKLADGSVAAATFEVCVVDRAADEEYLKARGTLFTPTTAALRTQRPWRGTGGNDGQDDPDMVYQNQEIWVTFATGEAEDFTLRIGAPQFTGGSLPCAPILGTAGVIAAYSKNGDILNSGGAPISGAETSGTLLVEGWAYRTAALNTQQWYLVQFDDGTSNNRVYVRGTVGGPNFSDTQPVRASGHHVAGGVSYTTPQAVYSNDPYAGNFRGVVSWGDDLRVAAGDEGTMATQAGVGPTAGLYRLLIQGNSGTDATLCYRRIRIYAGQLTDNQLVAMSGTGSTIVDGDATYDSGWIDAAVEAGYQQTVHILPEEVKAEALRCDLRDTANPDGFINIGLGYAGPVWQPTINVGWGTTFDRESSADRVQSRGGQEYIDFKWQARLWNVVFDAIRENEAWSNAVDLDQEGRYGHNVLFVPDPEGSRISKETVFGTMRNPSGLPYAGDSTQFRSWRFQIVERL